MTRGSTRWLWLGFVTASLLALSATGCRPDLETSSCQSDDDCFDDEMCVEGTCRVATTRGDDVVESDVTTDVGDDGGGVDADVVEDVTEDAGDAGDAVEPEGPARVLVRPEGPRVAVGETMRLQATVLDARGEVLAPSTLEAGPIEWSSGDESIATVQGGDETEDGSLDSSDGLVTGVAVGEEPVTIEATLGDLSGSVEAEVVEASVARVEVAPSAPTLAVSETVELSATAYDSRGNELSDRPVTWSVADEDSDVASVDDQGTVTAEAVGSAQVTAEVEGVQASVAVTVEPIPVDSVTLSPQDPGPVATGGTITLTAQPVDPQGNPLCSVEDATGVAMPCGREVDWFSGAPSVATVDATGVVTGQATGTARIFAIIEGNRASVDVEVRSNQPPNVDAGDDRTVSVGSTVTLDGSNTSDPDGDSLTDVQWSFASTPSGFSGSITNANDLSGATFDATESGTYEVTLTVGDGFVQATDTVQIAAAEAPTAEAGSNTSTTVESSVQLDGTGSSAPSGSLTYDWSVDSAPSGASAPAGSWDDPTLAQPEFTPNETGDYTIQLEVSANGLSSSDTVTVSSTNQAPNPSISAPVTTISDGQEIELDASGSSDPDTGHSVQSYSWSVTNVSVSGANFNLAETDTATPLFSAETPATYTIEVEVGDGWDTATTTVDIEVVDNDPPDADAGPELRASPGDQVTLDAGNTTDDQTSLQNLDFSWDLTSVPSGSSKSTGDLGTGQTYDFSTESGVTGTYGIELEVSDGQFTGTDTTQVRVESNFAPEADAGPDLDTDAGAQVTLDGSGSSDFETSSSNLNYTWTVQSAPTNSTASPASPNSQSTGFTPDEVGVYEIQLEVGDGSKTDTDTAVVYAATTPSAAGDLVVTEIMNNPSTPQPDTEWFELRNPSASTPYNLNGCTISDADGSYSIASDVYVRPESYATMARTTSVTFSPTATYDTLTLGDSGDTVDLDCSSGTDIDSVDYSQSGFPSVSQGEAQQLDSSVVTGSDPHTGNDDGSNWCAASSVFDSGSGDTGTPGAGNESCP